MDLVKKEHEGNTEIRGEWSIETFVEEEYKEFILLWKMFCESQITVRGLLNLHI